MLLSLPVLRGVIRCASEDERALGENLHALRFEFDPVDVDRDVLVVIGSLRDKSGETPTWTLLRSHFAGLAARGDATGAAACIRLDALRDAQAPFLSGVDFRHALDEFKVVATTEAVARALTEAALINTTGIPRDVILPGGKRQQTVAKGPTAVMAYLSQTFNALQTQLRLGSAESTVRADADAVLKDYATRRDTPAARFGILSGVEEIDNAHYGLKNGDLCLILGFTSHMKTTWLLDWVYRAVVDQRKNVGLISLETPLDGIRDHLYLRHCSHHKFLDRVTTQALTVTADKIELGQLTDPELAFFTDVVRDFQTSTEYGELYYKEPSADATVADIERWATAKHQQTPLDLLAIDYLALCDPEYKVSAVETHTLNRVVRQAKILAVTFAGGRGIPILSPHQASREGVKEAEKNGGRYTLRALALANEAERSTDLVYSAYLDDTMRNGKELLLGNLKARKRKLLTELFRVFADPATKRIDNLDKSAPAQQVVDL